MFVSFAYGERQWNIPLHPLHKGDLWFILNRYINHLLGFEEFFLEHGVEVKEIGAFLYRHHFLFQFTTLQANQAIRQGIALFGADVF